MLVESEKVVRCAFDQTKNCKANCAALHIVEQSGLVTKLMCNRMSTCIGNLKEE